MPNRYRERPCRARGFTLIELVMIVVIASVFGAVAVARHQPAEMTVSIEADHLARDIRHMQMLAVTWGQALRLTPAGTAYTVRCASGSAVAPCAGAGAVTDPANAAPFTRTLESNITVAGAVFDFDALGRPGTWAAGAPPTFTLATAIPAANFTLTGGSETSTVSVARLTGFVSVVY